MHQGQSLPKGSNLCNDSICLPIVCVVGQKNEDFLELGCKQYWVDNEQKQFDLVLMDIFLPVVTGIDLCKAIKQKYPQVIVIGMSSQSERSLVMQFIQNGGNGYILKKGSYDYKLLVKSIAKTKKEHCS